MAFYNEISDINSNISISFTNIPINELGAFAKGYSNSANCLSKVFLSKNHYPDYDGYPIVFLYRHAFELYLKNIIYKTSKLLNLITNDPIETLQTNHNLIGLAEKANKHLSKVLPNDKCLRDLCTKINKYAKEYHEIDRNSDSYRYPINKKEEHSTKKNQIVNIESLYNNFSIFLNELENVGDELYSIQFKVEEFSDFS